MKRNTYTTEIKYKYFHWGPFLFHTQITAEECQMVIKEGKKCRKKLNDFRHELAGHLSEEYILKNPKEITAWLRKYFEAYATGYNTWRRGGSMGTKFKLTPLWINYMKAGDFNPPHHHNGHLSFVLYPSMPEKIIEENKTFRGKRNPGGGPGSISWMYGEDVSQCISVVTHLPQTGDLFIFPASLKHWVFPFRSKVERISVSGNVLFEKESQKKEEDVNLSIGGGGGSNFDHSDRS